MMSTLAGSAEGEDIVSTSRQILEKFLSKLRKGDLREDSEAWANNDESICRYELHDSTYMPLYVCSWNYEFDRVYSQCL